MPVPRVRVRKSVRKPIRPRLGTMKSIRTQPAAWLAISSMRPLRAAISWVIAPTNSSGQSMVIASNGSCSLPSVGWGAHRGFPARPFETLATHLFDEHRQRQLTTTLDLPGVRPVNVDDLDRHVADEFRVQARLHH